MSVIFCYQSFLGSYCENYLKPLKEVVPHGYLHSLEETVVLPWYDLPGLAVKYLSIFSSLYLGEFHWGCKCFKVLEKENMTVPF